MAGEPGDLQRSIEVLTFEIRTLREELVRKDVYDADERRRRSELNDVEDDVRRLEVAQADAIRERRADRRVLYGALAASICTVIVNLYTQAGGAV